MSSDGYAGVADGAESSVERSVGATAAWARPCGLRAHANLGRQAWGRRLGRSQTVGEASAACSASQRQVKYELVSLAFELGAQLATKGLGEA